MTPPSAYDADTSPYEWGGKVKSRKNPGSETRRLPLEQTEVAHHAAWALGRARLAGIAAVQDQPVMGVQAVFLGYALQKLELDLERVLAGRQAGTVADAEDVGVDGDGGLAERHVHH